jgi:hypothetical protein
MALETDAAARNPHYREERARRNEGLLLVNEDGGEERRTRNRLRVGTVPARAASWSEGEILHFS